MIISIPLTFPGNKKFTQVVSYILMGLNTNKVTDCISRTHSYTNQYNIKLSANNKITLLITPSITLFLR